MGEHRLCEKGASERHSVEPTDQLSFLPGFNGMGIAEFVKARIGCEHLRSDPRAAVWILRPWFGAGSHDSAKAPVKRDAEYARTKTPLEAARDMEFLGKEHGPGIGRPPQYGLIAAVPGKDAVSIGFEQSFRSQVAADGEQAFGRGLLNRWKAQIRWVCA